MIRFTIRDVLWLTVVVALVMTAWPMDAESAYRRRRWRTRPPVQPVVRPAPPKSEPELDLQFDQSSFDGTPFGRSGFQPPKPIRPSPDENRSPLPKR